MKPERRVLSRRLIEALWGEICPDMGVDEFERRIRAVSQSGTKVSTRQERQDRVNRVIRAFIREVEGLPPDEPVRHPLDVRNLYELGN